MPADLPKQPRKRLEAYPALPFDTIRKPLDQLMIAMANLIEREWPEEYSENADLKVLLLGTVKITANTYNSIRYLSADKPVNINRKLEFSVSVPPLARTILDSLFTFVFLFDDAKDRITWYYKSGWREVWEEFERYKKAYGSDPNWKEYLSSLEVFVKHTRCEWGITDQEAENPKKKITWWPNPGKMAHHAKTSEERRRYLQYLNDWFYRNLSADSHLSWPGLSRRFVHFLNRDEEQRMNQLKKYKSDCVITTISLVLALLSEIECEFHFGRAERLRYIWVTLNGFSEVAKELYEFRYGDLL